MFVGRFLCLVFVRTSFFGVDVGICGFVWSGEGMRKDRYGGVWRFAFSFVFMFFGRSVWIIEVVFLDSAVFRTLALCWSFFWVAILSRTFFFWVKGCRWRVASFRFVDIWAFCRFWIRGFGFVRFSFGYRVVGRGAGCWFCLFVFTCGFCSFV